jgi:hypothetical protein
MENGMVTAPNLNCPPSWKARQKLITGTSAGALVGRHRMPAQSAFGKQTVIDQASRVHLRVPWLCGMVLFLEGYDIAAVGYAIPALVDTWRITASGLTPALTAGNVGLLLGSASCFLSRISGWRDRRLYPLAGGSRGGAANPVRAVAGAGAVIFYDWVGAGCGV